MSERPDWYGRTTKDRRLKPLKLKWFVSVLRNPHYLPNGQAMYVLTPPTKRGDEWSPSLGSWLRVFAVIGGFIVLCTGLLYVLYGK